MLERPPLSEKMPPAASKGIKKNKIDKVMTDRVQTFPCLDLLLCCSAQLPLGGRGRRGFSKSEVFVVQLTVRAAIAAATLTAVVVVGGVFGRAFGW